MKYYFQTDENPSLLREEAFAAGVLTGIKIAFSHGDNHEATREQVKALFVTAMRVSGDEEPEYWFDKLDF